MANGLLAGSKAQEGQEGKQKSRSPLTDFCFFVGRFLTSHFLTLSHPSCGEKTSPTPQADWSLDHTFKVTFDLNFFENRSSLFFHHFAPAIAAAMIDERQ
jgi:hypothetical protein